MKNLCMRAALGALLLAPAAAFAVIPGQWTGPFVGGQVGVNFNSSDTTSSERAFTANIFGGYELQLSDHFTVGGDLFYEWNNKKDHTIKNCLGPCTVNYGSNVYGVDGLVGFPVGTDGAIKPFVKVGYGRVKGTGDLSGNEWDVRYGAGVEFRSTASNIGFIVQYMYQKFGNDNFKNSNLTVGVTYHF
ncbi:MAG: porin family protein [Gammaproteobacteria bacterium]